MKVKGSYLDNRGYLVVDCAECTRGGNGNDEDKCSCGWKIKKINRGSCFSGTLMPEYERPLKNVEDEKENLISSAKNLAGKLELPTPDFEKMTLDQIADYVQSLKSV